MSQMRNFVLKESWDTWKREANVCSEFAFDRLIQSPQIPILAGGPGRAPCPGPSEIWAHSSGQEIAGTSLIIIATQDVCQTIQTMASQTLQGNYWFLRIRSDENCKALIRWIINYFSCKETKPTERKYTFYDRSCWCVQCVSDVKCCNIY